MGQAKKDRTLQYRLEQAETRLTETTTELLRRDRRGNIDAKARLEKEGTTSEPEAEI